MEQKSYSEGLKSLCPNLPQFEICVDDYVNLMTSLTVEDFEHFNKSGITVPLKIMSYICEGDGVHVQGIKIRFYK